MIKITSIPIFTDNYVHALIKGNECVVVDPGDASPVIDFLSSNNLNLTEILITHHHHDHIGGVANLKNKYGCKVTGPSYDKHRIKGIDTFVSDNDSVTVIGELASIIYTPGHTLGHICYYFKNLETLFCGDTLFSMGCGYLFEGSHQQMWDSLCKLKSLPSTTKVYCTHEYTLSNLEFALSIDSNNQELLEFTKAAKDRRENKEFTVPSTLATEAKLNPFLRANDPSFKAHLGQPKLSDADFFGHIRELKNQF